MNQDPIRSKLLEGFEVEFEREVKPETEAKDESLASLKNDKRGEYFPREVKVNFCSQPPALNHIICTTRDLFKYRRIKYAAMGRAVETLQLYKRRFLKFELGKIEDEKSFSQNGKEILSFCLFGHHSAKYYEKKWDELTELS